MKSLEEIRRLLQKHLPEMRERFGVRRIAIFGSYARSKATSRSDLDLLVELERPLGWDIVDLHDYLERLLGLKVDLTPGALKRKPWLWESVREDLQYV